MKRYIYIVPFLIILSFSAVFAETMNSTVSKSPAQLNDPAEGFWLSKDDKTGEITGAWRFWVENDMLFGCTVSIPGKPKDAKATGTKNKSYSDFPIKGSMSEMPLNGTPWIYNLQKEAEGVWSKGYIIDATNGMRYKCRIIFHKTDGSKYTCDTVEMRGEIGLGIGRSQFWTKTTEETACSL